MPQQSTPSRRWFRFAFLGLCALAVPTLSGGAPPAPGLKVDLNAGPSARRDTMTPHWENWAWSPAASGSQTFGSLTVTVRSLTDGGTLTPVLFKNLLDNEGATMACDGIASPTGGLEMRIRGLAPGRHTLVTYHNELGGSTPTPLSIIINDAAPVNVLPTSRAVNDYDVASQYGAFQAEAGKDVIVRFQPASGASGGVILNGFEIDMPDPRRQAAKPSPANDDEHFDTSRGLSWRAASNAGTHGLYFGSDADAVAKADTSSPEFKGHLRTTSFALPRTLDPNGTFYWRVDEEVNGETVRGDIWRFRPRALAFPTAQGYGRFARGGRGGRVIEVTNLQDYDPSKNEPVIPGSYRAAVEAEGPRTVVFRVSGVIRLKRPCAVSKPYCTVAGQTAPGDGICLANYGAGAFGTHDVIIRHMRFRVGDAARKGMDGAGLGSCNNAIMDHCSISWSSDEGTSSRGARNITFQHNIVSEALHHSYHYRASDRTKFATHAFAASISGDIGSFHHNLLAHCTDRNWSLAGGYNQSGQYAGVLDIRNNVVYNWTSRTTDGGVMQLNYVNNYYKPYPKNPFVTWLLKLDPIVTSHGTPRYFMSGNVMEGFPYESDNWKAFNGDSSVQKLVRVDKPLFEPFVQTETAQEAFQTVLSDVGASLPKQDVIDKRIIEEVRTGTVHYSGTRGPQYDPPSRNFAGIIDTPTDVKDAEGSPEFPWPNYRTYNVPQDSDHDGMPDVWERKYGLNPRDLRDGNQDKNGDGFTNLEEFLNGMAPNAPRTNLNQPGQKTAGSKQ